jgi:transcription-repair coupling factor (superfamily II helicase)
MYTHLGAGFKLALRDLEIRGAGNILGASQSGYIAAIGFDLYCELLRDHVNRLKNLPPEKSSFQKQCFIKLSFLRYRSYSPEKDLQEGVLSASIPKRYMNAENLRLECYRRLNKLSSEIELEIYCEELVDRFGKLPRPVDHLVSLTRLLILAEQRGITSLVERDDGRLFMESSRGHLKVNGRIPILFSSVPEDKLQQLFALVRSFPEKSMV